MSRRTIGASDNPAVLGGMRAKNNGRYNGNGREWETPPELFAKLDAEFHFTLDPCATPSSAKCSRFFSEEQDGLAQDWGTERVFMNPPYGREVYDWTAKARNAALAGALVVGLLPASTDLQWWHDDVIGGGAEVRFIRGRVRFLTGGPYRASGFFPSAIVVWRPEMAARSCSPHSTAGGWRCLTHEVRMVPIPTCVPGIDQAMNRKIAEARKPTAMEITRMSDGEFDARYRPRSGTSSTVGRADSEA